MPTSSWVQPSTSLVREKIYELLLRSTQHGTSPADLLGRFSRQQTGRQWDIIGQFEDDKTILNASIIELIKHPDAPIVQFSGHTLSTTGMWEWQRGTFSNLPDSDKTSLRTHYKTGQPGTPEETALYDFLAGALVPLNDTEKKAKLGKMKGSVRFISNGHGGYAPNAFASVMSKYRPVGLAEKIWLLTEHLPISEVDALYTGLRGCNMVLPAEQASDSYGFIGPFVEAMSRHHRQVKRVEASGYRFFTTQPTRADDLSLHRVLGGYADGQAAQNYTPEQLKRWGWSSKLRAIQENGCLASSGGDNKLTRFERSLIRINMASLFPGGIMELVGAMLKTLATSTVIGPSEKNAAHWEALRCLSQCIDISPYSDPWAESRAIQISGGKSDSFTFFFADQTVKVGGIRKHLHSFKYKALHGKTKFQNGYDGDQGQISTRELNAYHEDKDFLQKFYIGSQFSEEFYLPNDWLSAHAPSFSLQQKLAEGLPLGVPLRKAGLSAREEAALQIALKAPFQRRVNKLKKIPVDRDGTFVVAKVDVADKSEYYADAAKVEALGGKISDSALAKMLVFTVEFTESPDGSGVPQAPITWRTTLHDKETRLAVTAINSAINSAGDRMKSTIHRLNKYAAHTIDDAIQTPEAASDPFGYTVDRSPAMRVPKKR